MSDERYPEIENDTTPSEIIRILSEWDEPHALKAGILASMAHTEFRYAHADDEAIIEGQDDFLEFVEESSHAIQQAIERVDG